MCVCVYCSVVCVYLFSCSGRLNFAFLHSLCDVTATDYQDASLKTILEELIRSSGTLRVAI